MPQRRWCSPQQLYTAAIAGLASLACYVARPVPPAALASHPPARVSVTQSGSTIVVWYPHVVGDTLQGLVDGVRQRFVISPHTSIVTRQFAAAPTVALAMVGAGALAAYAYETIRLRPGPCLPEACPASPGCPPHPCEL